MSTSSGERADQLAGTILDLEAERTIVDDRPVVDVEALPGVGEDPITLADALTTGGKATFFTLSSLVAVDNLEGAALGTLAPNIRDSLGISSGAVVFISAAAGAFLVLGSLPMGLLGDRFRRSRVIGWASLLFASMVFLSGFVFNALTLFLTRMGAGIAKSNQYSVQGPLTADTYPIEARGRIFAGMQIAGSITSTLSPALVGAIAVMAGGDAGWRWAFIVLSIPAAFAALLVFRLPDPPRGQFEKKEVIGEIDEDDAAQAPPISMEAAFSRLLQINTLRTTILAFAAMGFGLFTAPVLANLFLEEQYDLGAFGRGAVGTVGGIAVLCTLPFVGKIYDRVYRKDPSHALRLLGCCVFPAALLTPVQYFMPNPVLFAIVSIPGAVLLAAAFAMVGPVMSSVVPYRLRGMGSALSSLYVFLIGATGGAIIAAFLTNSFGPRTSVLILFVPSTIIGGLLLIRGSSFIKDDLALVVAELREEEEERLRRTENPDAVPAIQVNHIDFAYGQVQTLFDVGFEVKRGETLALLGTNGAGKSTILRVIAGLGTPARGVVRLDGRSITYASPEQRMQLGIQMLPGGNGVWNDLTVIENLQVATFVHRSDPDDVTRRINKALELFPELRTLEAASARSLSGGQQQMLALACVLTREPQILIIDELSLGLAPIIVERLVGIISELKKTDLTIIIVEQSLNVAAAVADRAVFLEKGHVRFEGPMSELMERNDLARAVFLGSEGG